MADTMKAISLWQPWGSLWLSPAKRHETRHWQTRHRGKLLVHAAKKLVECDEERQDETAVWLRAAMRDGMAPLIDPVPVEVEVSAGRTWGG